MKILIAEDEPIIRLGLKSMLTELGHQVSAAANGQEALAMARREQFELAILDVRMPYTDGLQVTRTLERIYPLPIVLLTAYSEQGLVEEASNLPIHGYLVKPVRPEQLAATIAIASKRFADERRHLREKRELAEKLAGRRLIDRAKAQLMATGLSEEEAYVAIQERARRARRPTHEIAQEILDERE